MTRARLMGRPVSAVSTRPAIDPVPCGIWARSRAWPCLCPRPPWPCPCACPWGGVCPWGGCCASPDRPIATSRPATREKRWIVMEGLRLKDRDRDNPGADQQDLAHAADRVAAMKVRDQVRHCHIEKVPGRERQHVG